MEILEIMKRKMHTSMNLNKAVIFWSLLYLKIALAFSTLMSIFLCGVRFVLKSPKLEWDLRINFGGFHSRGRGDWFMIKSLLSPAKAKGKREFGGIIVWRERRPRPG